jgi:3-oxoacyl-[acyl-carrier-protein] synthase I
MTEGNRIYVAGIGMVTPLGSTLKETAIAVKAGISAYATGDIYDEQMQAVRFSFIDEAAYLGMDVEIDEGNYYSGQHDHVIKMSMAALPEALVDYNGTGTLPLILACAEPETLVKEEAYTEALIRNLLNREELPFKADRLRALYTGRAAGIDALDMAIKYLQDVKVPYVLVGAVDSFYDSPRLPEMIAEERLLSSANSDGFAPGEAASFFLLTKDINRAWKNNGCVFQLHIPGVARELGHLYSEEPCLGDGLDKAVKQAMSGYTGKPLKNLYSSMNGERYWSKELGTIMIRNRQYFDENTQVQHPLDCLGDMGSACGLVLAGIAIEDLANSPKESVAFVYASSDKESRAALRIDKIKLNS